MKDKKVLILYNKLFDYRIPIFELLGEKYDLTVAFSIGEVDKKHIYNFKTEKKEIKQIGRFVIHKENIFNYCQSFDVVIAYGEISWLKLSFLPLTIKKRNFKIIFWTIGVSASYEKAFGNESKWDKVRDFFYRRADALVFYTDYPINRYLTKGFNRDKLFVAHNTVKVEKIDILPMEKKNTFLFVGTLYSQKGIFSLLENYKRASESISNIYNLCIIGDGPDYSKVKQWITQNKLESKIELLGAIYNEIELSKYFNSAIACISPLQAGLTVLKSMGYGVPFITISNAITGGERLNIHDKETGLLYKNENDLTKIMIDINNNPEKYYIMGKNAKFYYEKYCKPEDMANGLINAINYVLKE